MKKLAPALFSILVAIGLLFIFVPPRTVLAVCSGVALNTCLVPELERCNNNPNRCCSTQQECRQQQNQQSPAEARLEEILCEDGGVDTAIGCIPTTPEGFLGKFLSLAIGIAGGIAFLLILFGGFQILTSAGNPEKFQAGKELIGSAITGLLLIIFSVFLLQFIGINIIGIKGFK